MTSTTPCLIGLDCGTQSAKACAWRLDGEPVARGEAALGVQHPREGWAEQDPGEWWTSARGALREAAAGLGSARPLALGLAFQRETFTLEDSHGRPLRPGILWLDVRAHEEVRHLASLLGEERCRQKTGKPLDVTSSLARLLWVQRHEPDLFARAARWVDVGSFVMERLTGVRASCAAGADTCGLVNIEQRDWDGELLAAAGLPRSAFPALAAPGSIVGALTPEAAAATGLPAGLPVAAAGGDGSVFPVGLGVGAGGSFSVALGTSVVLGLAAGSAPASPLCRALLPSHPGPRYLLEAVLQSGTYLLRWFADAFGGGCDLDRLEEEARGVPPGSDGLLTVPRLWGSRFPSSAPLARGATLGWSNSHGRAHFYRSLLEGIAFEIERFLQGFARLLPDAGERPGGLAVGGGGARSPTLLSILADVTGLEVTPSGEGESTALGAAILAGSAVGAFRGAGEACAAMCRRRPAVLPRREVHVFYRELFQQSYVPFFEDSLDPSARLRQMAGRAPR